MPTIFHKVLADRSVTLLKQTKDDPILCQYNRESVEKLVKKEHLAFKKCIQCETLLV